MLTHLVAQTFCNGKARGVFLCRDDQFGRGETVEGLVDTLDVFIVEVVVIAERQGLDLISIGLQILQHLFGRGDTRQQQDVLTLE